MGFEGQALKMERENILGMEDSQGKNMELGRFCVRNSKCPCLVELRAWKDSFWDMLKFEIFSSQLETGVEGRD